jgi:hypothetical protein
MRVLYSSLQAFTGIINLYTVNVASGRSMIYLLSHRRRIECERFLLRVERPTICFVNNQITFRINQESKPTTYFQFDLSRMLSCLNRQLQKKNVPTLNNNDATEVDKVEYGVFGTTSSLAQGIALRIGRYASCRARHCHSFDS